MIRELMGIAFLAVYAVIAIAHLEKAIRWWLCKKVSPPFIPYFGGLCGFAGCLIYPSIPLWVAVAAPFIDIGFVWSVCSTPRLMIAVWKELHAVYSAEIKDGFITIFRNGKVHRKVNLSNIWRLERRRRCIVIYVGPPSNAILPIPSDLISLEELEHALVKKSEMP